MRRFLAAIFLLIAGVTAASAIVPSQLASTTPKGGLLGLNLSGPEFAPWNGQTFPVEADFARLSSRGFKLVRLPIAWESIQPTLSAALDATYLGKVKTAIGLANKYGISVIVDVHNFGHWCQQTVWVSSGCGYAGNAGTNLASVNAFGDGTLTTTVFADLWTRLSTSLKGIPGVVGYDLMNEPTNIVGTNIIVFPNYFSGLATIGSQVWGTTNGSVPTIQAQGTNPLGATYGPAWTITSGTGFGSIAQFITLANTPYTLSAYCKVAAGTDTNFVLDLGVANNAHTCTTSWQRFTLTATPAAGSVEIQVQANEASGHTFFVSNVQLELGSSASAYVPNVFLAYAQAAANAIRSNGDNTTIYVAGDRAGNACTWPAINFEQNQITGINIVFEVHQYPDGTEAQCGDGGVFSSNYSGYAGLTNNSALNETVAFVSWTKQFGVKGYIGEFGIPNSAVDSNASWFPLASTFYRYLATNCIPFSFWFYGSNGVQAANILNAVSMNDPRNISLMSLAKTQCRRMNYLFKRDLDPASNDNAPMWLDTAA